MNEKYELVDVHCHLLDSSFAKDRDLIIKRAIESGVVAMINNIEDISEFEEAVKLSKDYEGIVYTAAGIHPNVVVEHNDLIVEKAKDIIYSNSDKIVAIGEVGLDYFYCRDEKKRAKMVSVFKEFCKIANELNLPVIVHSRSAGKYAIEVLEEVGIEKAILHAFDGKASTAKKGVELGYFFSIPPSIVRSQQKRNLVSKVPLNNLLLESDAPVLSPNERERNEPKNVLVSAQEIAKIKKIGIDEVVRSTTKNARKLLSI